VLVATASVGAGHNSVARAIVEQLRSAAPDLAVDCQDVMAFTPRLFRAYYAGGFALGMSRFPRAFGFGFWLTNRPQGPRRGLMERLRLFQERLVLRGFCDHVLAARPDLIVNTHFLAAPAIAALLAAGRLNCPQVTVVTDIEVHRFWYSQRVRHWFVPSDYSAQPLTRWGVLPEQITVSGIPIHPKWVPLLDRRKVLADWKLPADKTIVILTGGTEFLCAPVPKIAVAILAACPHVHLVVLAGRNKKLLEELARLPQTPARLTPLGFTDRAQELVEVCSLMLTKAGGITTAECLAKGTPMILMRPVPGHEGGNARYLAGQGAAVIARGLDDIVGQAARLLNDPPALAAMAEHARRLYKPGTQTVVNAIAAMAAGRPGRSRPN
jgi:processive 1,2-diacylglycerol beta-glucosyltransferase